MLYLQAQDRGDLRGKGEALGALVGSLKVSDWAGDSDKPETDSTGQFLEVEGC